MSGGRGLTDLPGVRVGTWSDPEARTGCTVVLLHPEGCVASGRVAGPAPGGRETSLLDPEKSVQHAHALVMAGGSGFGLDAAGGVTTWLERQGRGFPTPFARVPIVPAAVLYDLGVGRADVRPTAEDGVAACEAAHDGPVEEGAVGAGTGATIRLWQGREHAVASGQGSAAVAAGGATVAALAVSNAFGTLVDPADGRPVVGPLPTVADLVGAFAPAGGTQTTLVTVGTDAPIDKAGARALADAAHAGIARVTRPSHTAGDGDTCFVFTTGTGPQVPLAALGVAVQEVVADALLRGYRAAHGGAS